MHDNKISEIDRELDALVAIIVADAGNGWSKHASIASDLLERRIKMTRPKRYARIQHILNPVKQVA